MLKRAIVLRRKEISYEELTSKIESTRDTTSLRKLGREREALKYDPRERPEGMISANRGKIFVDLLSEREMSLVHDEDMATECENTRIKILSLCKTIGIELDSLEEAISTPVLLSPTLKSGSPPSKLISSLSGPRPSFKYKSDPITLNEEKCREQDGIYFGSFSLIL